MNDKQRSAIKFCVQNGFSKKEKKKKITEMLLNAYREMAMKKKNSSLHDCGREGRENVYISAHHHHQGSSW